jgi:hypothetical protein
MINALEKKRELIARRRPHPRRRAGPWALHLTTGGRNKLIAAIADRTAADTGNAEVGGTAVCAAEARTTGSGLLTQKIAYRIPSRRTC